MLPASGEISIGSIYNELTGAYPEAYSDRSINQCETGTYGAINQNSAAKPDGATPYGFNEWYSYNHSAGPSKTTEWLTVYDSGAAVWVESSATEPDNNITIYGNYLNQDANITPFSVILYAGSTVSDYYYDPYYFTMNPTIDHIAIGGVSYYTSPVETSTHYWEWDIH